MASTCSNEKCNAHCHQVCNGWSTSQTHHAKNSGHSITWKCPQYGTGITKIIMPPAPVYVLPSCPSAVGKSCSVCKTFIRTHYADLDYHCANPSWDVCHLAATYSRFVNPRGSARACALSTKVWHCNLHSSPSATSHLSLSPDNSPPRPTPQSLKSLLNQDLSLADAKSSKEKCAKSLLLYVLTLSQWGAVYAPRDSMRNAALDRKLTRDNHWKCKKCTNIQQNRTSESINRQLPGSTNSSPSKPVPTTSWNKLKIYQWNADGIRPKFIELCDC